MPNSIIQQANDLVSNGESRLNTKNSINELERQQQAAQLAQRASEERSQRFQAVAQYQASGAEQEKIQGNNLLLQGNVKVAAGAGEMVMGGILMALAAIPAFGAAFIAKGMAMIAKGGAQIGLGMADITQGKNALQRAQQKLDEAVNNKILGKEEAKIANKEMMRSRIMETKKQLLQDMIDVMRPMLEEAGFDPNDLNEDQLTKMFDKFFEDAAEYFANGRIMEEDFKGLTADGESPFLDPESGEPLEGPMYFIKDENDDYFKVNLLRDENGNAATGALGEPLVDLEQGVTKIEDGDLKDYLDLKFTFVDHVETLISEMSTTQFDSNENSIFRPMDIENLADMREFADLVRKTNTEGISRNQISSPRKFFVGEDGEMYFQEWDWDNDIPIGPRVSMTDITGGEFAEGMRSNIDNFQLALERSDNALRALGLNAGGAVFNDLSSQDTETIAIRQEDSGPGFDDLSSRNSNAFRDFANVTTTLDLIRTQGSVFDSSVGDSVGNGRA